MDELGGKDLFKLMWLPGEKAMIWKMKDESIPESDSVIYDLVMEHFDLAKWTSEYTSLYRKWLDGVSSEIHDLNHQINASALSALKKINHGLNRKAIVFYWFDIDRTENGDFIWIKSPISGEALMDLGPEYHSLNRLISLSDSLVLPAIAN